MKSSNTTSMEPILNQIGITQIDGKNIVDKT